jgi:membrane-bound lytic murein transglycosylase F
LRINSIFILFLAILAWACSDKRQQESIVTPWGEVADSADISDDFDLDEIQSSGEMILLTLTGPQYYYDYRGRHLGTQYLLAEKFARQLGVRLRVEICRDSAEMVRKLSANEGDIMASTKVGRLEVSPDKHDLQRELDAWYHPRYIDEVRKQEEYLLSSRSVKRRIFSPMLNRKGGIISHYDGYFIQYCRAIRWDWRLMAAQCYQESTFDPRATSWAGAKGLMQIMPGTADHLGLPRDKMYDPESNIAAATKYLSELERLFSDVRDRRERTSFILAAYNGGTHHIRDAMALCQRDGRNPHQWRNVEEYVLKLSLPQYYNDPLVKYGYMRGSETTDYVSKIHERWTFYRGVRSPRQGLSQEPRKARRSTNKYKI